MKLAITLQFFVKNHEFQNAKQVLQKKVESCTLKTIPFQIKNNLIEISFQNIKNETELEAKAFKYIKTTSEIIKPYILANQSVQELKSSSVEPKQKKELWSNIYGSLNSGVLHTLQSETLNITNFELKIQDEMLSDDANKKLLVAMLDLFVAIPSVALCDDITAKVRRKIYGTAGTYKPMKDGIVYGVLDTTCISGPERLKLIYQLIQYAFTFVKGGEYKRFWNENNCYGYNLPSLISTINDFNNKESKKFISFIGNFIRNTDLKKLNDELSHKSGDFYENWSIPNHVLVHQ